MNAFFASVEQRCNPRLRGRPIAVVGRGARTVVTTASYEARARGVKTGMNVREARRCCPEIIFVEAHNTRYTDTCAWFVELCRAFTPAVEVFSIDEVFLDLTGCLKLFGPVRGIVSRIKERLRAQTGLTCSAGIAPNKLLAKLASGMQKPDGLVEIAADEVPRFLENLPAAELCGIGPKLQARLARLGIRTCGELGRADPLALRLHFGLIGEVLSQMGRGEDSSPVVPLESAPAPCSVGHSLTLPRDLCDRRLLDLHLLRLSEMVGRRARQAGLAGQTVALTIRYRDFTTFTRQRAVAEPLSRTHDIHRVAKKILDALRLQQAVRLIGVSLGNLVSCPRQLPLFPGEVRQGQLTRAMDAVNSRFGDFTLTWASLHLLDEQHGVIAPAWRPCGPRRIEF
jgi:DNA polymerase-4